MTDSGRLRSDARAIFRAGVARVDPRPMVRDAVSLDGNALTVVGGNGSETWDLSEFSRILVLGFGKAGARMAQGAADALGDRLSGGLVVVKRGFAETCPGLDVLEAGHPVPDADGVAAARTLMAVARAADEKTLVLVLVSGGGSALLCAPWEDDERELTLEDKACVTSLLLASGADIREINTVRRHLSAVKGGRLASLLHPASVATLILSDVVGDELSSIASGPTVPDLSTWADALTVVTRYGLVDKLPAAARRLLEDGVAGLVPDTPKPGDPAFSRVRTLVIGSNRLAALAGAEEASRLGYRTLYLGSRITGEAREIARVHLGLALDMAASGAPLKPPACVISGGETTVTLRGTGRGGRNQEQALAFAVGLSETNPELASRVCYLSAGTDGNDGPTDAAGGYADAMVLQAAQRAGLDPRAFLEHNDSYRFLDALGALERTGPTGTNVCDLHIVLVR